MFECQPPDFSIIPKNDGKIRWLIVLDQHRGQLPPGNQTGNLRLFDFNDQFAELQQLYKRGQLVAELHE
jgi:hypothetical protein